MPPSVRTEVHESRRPHRGAPGADAARGPRSRSRSGDRGLARVRRASLARPTSSCRRRCIRRESRRAARGACSTRSPTRSICGSRSTRRAPRGCGRRSTRNRRRHLRRRLLRQPAAPRPGDPRARSTTSCCGCSTPRRCSASTRCAASSAATSSAAWTRTWSTSRQWFVPLLKEAKARGLTYRVEQCPMPGWTTGDNLHNNIAYTPGHLDCAAPHLREARRRRSVPHPLRPVARHPDGAGHALDLPVPEGRGLQLPDRRLPRQGPGRRRQGRLGLGLRRPDGRARRLEGRQAVATTRPIS